MIDKSIIQTSSSWPFVEARKLIKERQKIYEKKGKITYQPGYRPSALPLIGTFAEDRKVLLFSSYKNCTNSGISMNVPNITRSTPIAKKTVLLLFIFEVGGYLKIFEIQHNKTLLYLYFTYEI